MSRKRMSSRSLMLLEMLNADRDGRCEVTDTACTEDSFTDARRSLKSSRLLSDLGY